MRAGRLRHRLEIQAATEARDAAGGVTRTWATEATVWGAVEPFRGREVFEAGQVESEATHRIIVRYRGNLTSDKRIKFGTRVFNIDFVANRDERNREIEILAVERVGQEADAI